MAVGLTVKLAPPAEVPIGVPPAGVVYQVTVYVELAERLEDALQLIVDGVAEIFVGTGRLVTVTETETAMEVPQNELTLAQYVVLTVGKTLKPAPLAEEPSKVPPVEDVHHWITPFDVTALNAVETPVQIVFGVARIFVGAEGVCAETVIVTDVLVTLGQVEKASA